MHRVLSLEASRCPSTSSEVVSKRFCCSLSLAVSFFALIAGFFLGKSAAERSHIWKKCPNKVYPENSHSNFIFNMSNTLKNTDRLLDELPLTNLAYCSEHDTKNPAYSFNFSCKNLTVKLNLINQITMTNLTSDDHVKIPSSTQSALSTKCTKLSDIISKSVQEQISIVNDCTTKLNNYLVDMATSIRKVKDVDLH